MTRIKKLQIARDRKLEVLRKDRESILDMLEGVEKSDPRYLELIREYNKTVNKIEDTILHYNNEMSAAPLKETED